MTITLDRELLISKDFDPASDEDWTEAATKMMKGAPLEKLLTTTAEGITIRPLYTETDVDSHTENSNGLPGQAPYIRGNRKSDAGGDWLTCLQYADCDTAAANDRIKKDITRGAHAVWLKVTASADIKQILTGLPEDTTFFLDAGTETHQLGKEIISVLSEPGISMNTVKGGLYTDPLGGLAAHGNLRDSLESAYDQMAATTSWFSEHAPQFGSVSVSLEPYHNAGADMVLELAVFLSTTATYLRELENRGLDIELAAHAFEAIVPVGRDTFREIAKIRALRGLWSHLLHACGMDNIPPLRINAIASAKTMSVRDPWVNMLRATAEAFAGGIGGADIVTSRPFDEAAGARSELGNRMAINTQTILQQESHLGFVTDPAGGSFYLEKITAELQERGWARMQELETEGGVATLLQNGNLAAHLKELATAQQKNIAKRKTSVVGVSAYPDIAENKLKDDDLSSKKSEANLSESAVSVDPLIAFREAESFEARRDLSDAYLQEHGSRPTVFLANYGPIPKHKPRSTFAKNFFETGGLETLSNDGFESTDSVVTAFKESGSRLAAICSSDDIYAESAVELAGALKQAGAVEIWLAGRPGDLQTPLSEAGAQRAIYVGCDVLVELDVALAHYGVQS